jgi:thiamine monophosphate kinase
LGEDAREAALYGGDDYQLILVADRRDMTRMQEEMGVTVVGEIAAAGGVRVVDASGKEINMEKYGYEHFREE